MDNDTYFKIGGITLKFSSDMPVPRDMFNKKFFQFAVDIPGEDVVSIRHHQGLPFSKIKDLGKKLYFNAPWGIFQNDDQWIYIFTREETDDSWHDLAIFNRDYSEGDFYHLYPRILKIDALTYFTTDQILIAQLLADRKGIYLHSGAVKMGGAGLMFIGHSGAGKSTTMKMLADRVEILCDDRNIVRQSQDGFHVYGSWSHGELPAVSSSSAPLKAILFLKKSDGNRLIPIKDKQEVRLRLLACLIKPLVTADWWDKSLAVVNSMADTVPCYEMEFDMSGQIVPVLEALVRGD